jgi:hypothetical protein
MFTNSKIALSFALVVATASAAIAAPKAAVRHHQTATVRHLPAASARSGEAVNSANPCYFKIQTIGNEDSDGFTPTDYNCRQFTPGRS